MRLHNFFVEEKLGDKRTVVIRDSNLLHQWRQVLRFNTGSLVVLLDNSGYEYLSQITSLLPYEAHLTIMKTRRNRNLPSRVVHLYQALIKKDKFELVLQKGTELGVSHFHPVITSRIVKKRLDMKRARVVIREAAEQSTRGVLPAINEPLPLEAVIADPGFPIFAFDGEGKPFDSRMFRLESARESLGFLIGPEGGWTDQELALFRERGIPILSLGRMTLWAETAAIAAAALALL